MLQPVALSSSGARTERRGPTPGLTSTNLTHKDIHGDKGHQIILALLFSPSIKMQGKYFFLNIHTYMIVMMALIIMSCINVTDSVQKGCGGKYD